jgi:hypothetical protein
MLKFHTLNLFKMFHVSGPVPSDASKKYKTYEELPDFKFISAASLNPENWQITICKFNKITDTNKPCVYIHSFIL